VHVLADGRQALEETETAANREPSTSRNNSGEAPMMAERLHSRALVQHKLVQHKKLLPDRGLRNRIIIGNAIAWIAIVILIRLLFF
jgi:hypothetical protein